MRRSLPIAWALVVLTACAAPAPRYGLLEGEPEAEVLQHRIRAAANEASLTLTNLVGSTSAEILLESADPAVRRAALTFWSRVGDEAARTLYHQDPVASAVDLTALLLQLQDWLAEGGDGSDAFGAQQHLMRETIDGFAERIVGLLEDAESAFLREEALGQARAWANANPLEGSHLARVSIAPLMGRLGGTYGRSVFQMADSVEDSISSIETRLEVLSHRLPAQLITQAMFLIEAYLDRFQAEDLAQGADAALQELGDLDDVLERERVAILAEVERQRQETLVEVDAQLRTLREHVSSERAVTLERLEALHARTLTDLERQRTETLDRLDALSQGVLAELDRQGQGLADRLDGTLERSIATPLAELRAGTIELGGPLGREAADDLLQGARELVDGIFLRALAVVGLLGVSLVVAAAVLRRKPA